MTLEKAIDHFLDSGVHLYLKNGAYIKEGMALKFDKEEHDKHFAHGYYKPDYKKWLLENAQLVPANEAD